MVTIHLTSFGIEIKYAVQEIPMGIVESFLIGKDFIKDHSSVVILGDNLFHGQNFIQKLQDSMAQNIGATIMVYPVSDPQNYGIVEFDKDFKINSEKDNQLNYAIKLFNS